MPNENTNNSAEALPSLEDLLGQDFDDSLNKSSSQLPHENNAVDLSSSVKTESLEVKQDDLIPAPQTSDTALSSDQELSLDDLLLGDTIDDTPKNSLENASDKKEDANDNIFSSTFKTSHESEDDFMKDLEGNLDGVTTEHVDNEEEKPADEDHLHVEFETHEREEDPEIIQKRELEAELEMDKRKRNRFLSLANGSLTIAILFGVVSYSLFSFLLNPTGIFSNIAGDFSTPPGKELVNLNLELEESEENIQNLRRSIKKTEDLIASIKSNNVLETIISNRVNWIESIENAETIAREAANVPKYITVTKDGKKYKRLNDEWKQYYQFEQITTKGDIEGGKAEVLLKGTVSSTSGNLFQRVSDLVEEFNASPYFTGATMRQFSRTKKADGFRETMSFSFKLQYHKDGDTELLHGSSDEEKKKK